ncbi:MAG: hypothetical protein RR034_00085 [Bacteroidales bacterium]
MILSKIRNSWTAKVIALFLLIGFLLELLQPLQLYALTGGPSQPEMSGFTPVNTDDMVDLFSGDFHYTIPLMTVPGPSGGYPINLNYTSGVGMEQEASWVGLGWNLNPGAINRQVRGIPDDFQEEEITKTYKRRDNNTFIFTPNCGIEVFGANFGIGITTSSSFIYNTYNGISLSKRFGVSASYARNGNVKNKRSKICTSGLGINLDSDNGITSSFSMNGGSKNLKLGFNYGFNSKSGNYTFSNQIIPTSLGDLNGVIKIGTSFSTAAHLPPIIIPLTNNTFAASGQIGGTGVYVEGFGNVAASVCAQTTPGDEIKTKAFGLLYADKGQYIRNSLHDFNREKEICVDESSLNLPLPVMTHDVYSVMGEQMRGSFRAYRSDYGHFFDNYIRNTTNTLDIGVDVAAGNCVQVGTNLSDNASFSESGDWNDGYSSKLSFRSRQYYANNPQSKMDKSLYEPFYFKMSGEQTATNQNYLQDIGGTDAVRFPIKKQYTYSIFGGKIPQYFIDTILQSRSGMSTQIVNATQIERTKRSSNIEYKTGKSNESNRKSHHISEFNIVNADGERYTYGQTLYNHQEKEVQFSIRYQGNPSSHQATVNSTYTMEYDNGNANGTSRVGKEKLYSCTQTPPYAYSYLLTSITSPDYVDVNDNGPDNADFGYWVKLSYKKVYGAQNPYYWRFPYKGANFFMGDRSNETDDKGNYHYGSKEIAYVDTIQTKTHYAIFYSSPRQDAYGVGNSATDEYKGGYASTSSSLYKLDSIQLFSKEAPIVPIKTAVFTYDYSLCPGTFNSMASGNGKLTLKSVYFKYAKNEKGKQNPYKFTYSDVNPSYHPVRMDRWGNYKNNANYFEHYVTQNPTEANTDAKAWLLTDIILPEGGSIHVEYESDDYGYVQNRQAMYMEKLVTPTSFSKEADGRYYVYFAKKSGVSVKEYIKNFDHNLIFFKIANCFKSLEGEPDYIQGYMEMDVAATPDNTQSTTGKIAVKAFSGYDIHPIYLLSCQYLKNNRPDLLFGNQDANENQSDAIAFFKSLVSDGIISEFKSMYGNDKFYKHCIKKRYYKKLILNDSNMPSYIRLNVPGKIKYGGGSRVKSIALQDNWTKSESASYKREYFYRTVENGRIISSGVAEYEPNVCSEETALRYPVYDQTRGLFFVEDEMYSEEPYGESYFPAANVGYGRVLVRTSTPPNVTLSNVGIQIHEFYTAQDFPVTVSQTNLQVANENVPNLLSMITAGFKQVNNSAFSQGYQIELNDMHGKQKAVSTCPYIPFASDEEFIVKADKSGFTSKVEYLYKEKTVDRKRKIDNEVEVLVRDGCVEKRILGQTYDFIIDQRENFSESIGAGVSAQFMLGNCLPPTPGVSASPSFDSFQESVRSVATTKVIYNTGILEKTIAYNKGSKITTTHLQWDPYTGQPLLTTVTNEFEKPVYHYSMPAYWYDANMRSAADNYGAVYQTSFGNVDTNIFSQYDRVLLGTEIFPVKEISGTKIKYWKQDGTESNLVSGNGMQIMRSRNTNQLKSVAATTISLTNPISQRRLPMLEGFTGKPCFQYTDCVGEPRHARIEFFKQRFYFFGDDELGSEVCLPSVDSLLRKIPYVQSDLISVKQYNGADFQNLYFTKFQQFIRVYNKITQRFICQFEWNDPQGIFQECLDGVLQASAVEYDNRWNYPYVDAAVTIGARENYLGIPNIYRSLRSNLVVTDRKQTGEGKDAKTNIAYDGTFSMFMFFNFYKGNAGNMQKPWTWTAEITKYNPFNFEIENVNALGVYSSALYGYKNSLVTAVANNARYCEIGFDSFENDLPFNMSIARGHLKYGINQYAASLDSTCSHTGKYSLRTNNLILACKVTDNLSSATYDGQITLQKNKKYIFSCWVRPGDCETLENLGNSYNYKINGVAGVLPIVSEKVDCWQRVEFTFTIPLMATGVIPIEIYSAPTENHYFDDIRIMPVDATFKSYLYAPDSYRLISELDENNYATFYNYDEEGILVQIKKETEQGIRTLKTTRQSLKK